MATKTGVWNLQQVRDKQLQDLWSYSGAATLWVWGKNDTGSLGQNDNAARSSPVQVPGNWVSAQIFRHVGESDNKHTGVVKNDGTLWMWGNNDDGELGQNNSHPVNYSSPVQVGSGTDWSTGSNIRRGTGAVKTDGTLWSWGYGNWGMLGQNESNIKRSSPVQIPGTTWSQIVGGHLNVFGLKTDGELWAWGNNHNGKLGLNQNENDSGASRSSPAQIPGTTWASVAATPSGGRATKTDGTLWTWGYNGYGQLGDNSTTSRSSPTQIPGTTWGTTQLTLPNGNETQAAIKTDGTLWMWGYNNYGQLGQNNKTSYSSPRQVGSDTTWRSITSLGMNSTYIATKTDGTLWGLGSNHDGLCAQNNDPDNGGIDSYSSPIQIPGTVWTEMIGAAGYGAAIIKGES